MPVIVYHYRKNKSNINNNVCVVPRYRTTSTNTRTTNPKNVDAVPYLLENIPRSFQKLKFGRQKEEEEEDNPVSDNTCADNNNDSNSNEINNSVCFDSVVMVETIPSHRQYSDEMKEQIWWPKNMIFRQFDNNEEKLNPYGEYQHRVQRATNDNFEMPSSFQQQKKISKTTTTTKNGAKHNHIFAYVDIM